MGPQPFKASRGRIKVALQVPERELLARLIDDVAALLEESRQEAPTTDVGDPDWAVLEAALSAPPPQDPAVARLLPDGHRENPELAESFRRLTEHSLREKKRSALSVASAALRRAEPVVLEPLEAAALVKALTDVRLVVAERLGVRTDEDAELLHEALRQVAERGEDAGVDPEWVGAAAIYDALTWWQEVLVGALE